MKPSAVTNLERAPLRSPLVDLLDAEFADELDGLPVHLWERALAGPAREFLRRPGKQFRARLVEAGWLLGGGAADAMPARLPLIVEILHAGSLIVDDIEDQSAVRRGEPTLHRVYGTALALNTGNWMYFWPFAVLERMDLAEQPRERIVRHTLRTLARCHRGQALDLAFDVGTLDQADVPKVVEATTRLKTGSLMELGAAIGAIAAGADDLRVEALAHFGRELGCGLQMLDDLGGLCSAQRAHKGHEDLQLGRPTWPWAWAADWLGDTAYARAKTMSRAVCDGEDPQLLAMTLKSAVAERGRATVDARLRTALASLRQTLGPSEILGALEAEIDRLEKSYG